MNPGICNSGDEISFEKVTLNELTKKENISHLTTPHKSQHRNSLIRSAACRHELLVRFLSLCFSKGKLFQVQAVMEVFADYGPAQTLLTKVFVSKHK